MKRGSALNRGNPISMRSHFNTDLILNQIKICQKRFYLELHQLSNDDNKKVKNSILCYRTEYTSLFFFLLESLIIFSFNRVQWALHQSDSSKSSKLIKI